VLELYSFKINSIPKGRNKSVTIFFLTLTSFASWFVSTLAGGGTPLLLIPLIGSLLGAAAVPPVLTIGMLLGHPQRIILYWQFINWQIFWWYLPGAIVGACLGSFVYSKIQIAWLPILLALLLISSAVGSLVDEAKPWFKVRPNYFLPAGSIFAFLSGLIGSAGPLLNPLYINYGLKKEETIATKSAHLLVVHIVKTIAYFSFGTLNWHYLGYGLLIGLAAIPGNLIGKVVLQDVSERRFRQLLASFVFISGFWLLWEQRNLFY
jgi:uncharacterized membrane protein YfcA